MSHELFIRALFLCLNAPLWGILNTSYQYSEVSVDWLFLAVAYPSVLMCIPPFSSAAKMKLVWSCEPFSRDITRQLTRVGFVLIYYGRDGGSRGRSPLDFVFVA